MSAGYDTQGVSRPFSSEGGPAPTTLAGRWRLVPPQGEPQPGQSTSLTSSGRTTDPQTGSGQKPPTTCTTRVSQRQYMTAAPMGYRRER